MRLVAYEGGVGVRRDGGVAAVSGYSTLNALMP